MRTAIEAHKLLPGAGLPGGRPGGDVSRRGELVRAEHRRYAARREGAPLRG